MDISTHEFLENMSNRFRDLECGGNREAARSVSQDFVETIFRRTYSRNAHDAKGKCVAEKHRLEDILPITEESASVEELVKAFDDHIVRKGLPLYHPGFMGMIPGSGNYIYALAQHLASVSQVLVVDNFSNPGACKIEKTVLDWVSSLLGFPAESRGVFTSGTSMGAVLAFSAARDDRLANLSRLDRAVVYMTNQCHFSNARSLNVTGMRACPRRTVPVDSHQRMDADALEKLVIQDKENGLLPFLVVGSLGTTNFGAVDPIDEIGQVSRRHGLWFHVDGAYGGFFLASKVMKAKCKGIEFADSMTLDFHKGLSAPFGTSVMLVRDGQTLKHSMEWDNAPYIPDANRHIDYEPINYTFEVTRPFRAFPVWFALRHLGTKLIEDHFEEKLILANYAYVSLNAMTHIDVFTQPDLSIVAFRFVATGFNEKDEGNKLTSTLLRLVNSSGTVFLSSTRVQRIEYIRFCVLSFRSHLPEVNTALELIREKADWMSKNMKRSQTNVTV